MLLKQQHKSEEDWLFEQYRKHGDNECFHRLFAMISPWLLKMIYRITCDIETAKDIEQDSWLKILNNTDEYNVKKGKITNLIFTIAKNNALMWLRKKKTEQKYNYTQESDENDNLPDKLIEDNERRDVIKKAIKSLPEKNQDVLVLYYLAELKIAEISDLLETPENTIKTRLRRGKIQLEKSLYLYFESEYRQ